MISTTLMEPIRKRKNMVLRVSTIKSKLKPSIKLCRKKCFVNSTNRCNRRNTLRVKTNKSTWTRLLKTMKTYPSTISQCTPKTESLLVCTN